MPFGSLMIDVAAPHLTAEDCELLKHPLVGGIILFTRNFESIEQLTELTRHIHALREPALLIAVDHEGGPVQRFREPFTPIPAMACLGNYYLAHPQQRKQNLQIAQEIGWLLAAELRAVGVDFSFTPVLDLATVASEVMQQRTLAAQADVVSDLANALMYGMQQAGMAAVGKHFPGHGAVSADSHHTLPVDERSYADIQMADLIPFARLISNGLPAIMPAHVQYPQLDERPAGFSHYWLQTVLRQQLDFQGMIFSDDLNMAGAAIAGDMPSRVALALAAGCDMLLICNNRAGVVQVLDTLKPQPAPQLHIRAMRMHGQQSFEWSALHNTARWLNAQQACATLKQHEVAHHAA